MTGNAIQLANQQLPLIGHLLRDVGKPGLNRRCPSGDDGQRTDQNETHAYCHRNADGDSAQIFNRIEKARKLCERDRDAERPARIAR